MCGEWIELQQRVTGGGLRRSGGGDQRQPPTIAKVSSQERSTLLGGHGTRASIVFEHGSDQLRADVATLIEDVPVKEFIALGWLVGKARTGRLIAHLAEE